MDSAKSSISKGVAEKSAAPECVAAWSDSGRLLRDEVGLPLVVFHGSRAKFDAFDMMLAKDGGHWFTPDAAHAASFGPVRAFHLSMSSPLVIDQDDLDAAWDREHPDGDQDERGLLPRDFVGDFVERAKSLGHDGLVIRDMGDRDISADMYLIFEASQAVFVSEEEVCVDSSAAERHFNRARHGA